jgi:hypothetical protein
MPASQRGTMVALYELATLLQCIHRLWVKLAQFLAFCRIARLDKNFNFRLGCVSLPTQVGDRCNWKNLRGGR